MKAKNLMVGTKNAILASMFLLLVPVVTHAQDAEYFRSLVTQSGTLINLLIGLATGIALLLFFWGLALFIFKADDESERAKGRQMMIWGIVALFAIVSVWGIVLILRNITDTNNDNTFNAPGVMGVE